MCKRYLLLVCLSLTTPTLFSSAAISDKHKSVSRNVTPGKSSALLELYNVLSLDSLGLSRAAFDAAIIGYQNLQKTGAIIHAGILSIVDFSLPSFKKRLFVLDLENGKLLFNTLVAHGRNSGQLVATKFSNRSESRKQPGFISQAKPIMGKKAILFVLWVLNGESTTMLIKEVS
jgi:hypothetical protein